MEQNNSLEKARMVFNIHLKTEIISLTPHIFNHYYVCFLEFLSFLLKC